MHGVARTVTCLNLLFFLSLLGFPMSGHGETKDITTKKKKKHNKAEIN